jgi:23S rRNA pseudouridine1911/1915/1917 synthase
MNNNEKETVALEYTDSAIQRIDRWLHDQFPDYSRSHFKKLIEAGHIVVNNDVIKKGSLSLKAGDTVSITFASLHEYKVTPLDLNLDIIDIQDDFIILNKPARLVVHNTHTNPDEPSVVRGLLYQFKEFAEFEDHERPGIVHRLDKDTSGLLIVARTEQALPKLSALFKDRKISKTYLAAVKGHTPKQGTIDTPIGRHPIARQKMSCFCIARREAVSHYTMQEYFDEQTLVSIAIETGRTHQIRVHMASIGHSVIGDTTYGSKSKHINRQALHAHKLSFEYNGTKYDYQAPLHKDFLYLLSKLKENTDF